MDKLYKWDRQLAALLMLSFFLPLRVQVFVMIPICVFFGLRGAFLKKSFSKTRLAYAVLLGGLYLLYVAYLPFTPAPYKGDLRSLLEQKSSLLLFPLTMACLDRETMDTIVRQL